MNHDGATRARRFAIAGLLAALAALAGGCDSTSSSSSTTSTPGEPSLTFQLPEDGATVSESVSLEVTGVEIDSVEFLVDDELVHTDQEIPFAWSFVPADHADGAHEVTVRALHASGSESRSVVLLVECPGAPDPDWGLTIVGIDWDFGSHETAASGSDNWPVAWADDDLQYTSWGDGGGFNGTNGECRVGIGFASVDGPPDAIETVDIWGSSDSGCALHEGNLGNHKCKGLLYFDGTLWAWTTPGSGSSGYDSSWIWASTDKGASWTAADWRFSNPTEGGMDNVQAPGFLTAGQNYADRFDDYAYAYYIEVDTVIDSHVASNGNIHLMRVRIAGAGAGDPMRREDWEFFAGLKCGDPLWTSELSRRRPVYTDPRGTTDGIAAIYLPRYDEVVVCWTNGGTNGDRVNVGNFIFVKARRPWGPYEVIEEYDSRAAPWGPKSPLNFNQQFYGNFSDKWTVAPDFVFVFTGVNEFDSWNTVRGTFIEDAGD
jgi:hypothetical protein